MSQLISNQSNSTCQDGAHHPIPTADY